MKFLARFTVALVIFLAAGAVAAQQSDRDRGIDLYREGKFPEAIVLLEKSIAANETDRAAWLYLGGAHVYAGDESNARKAFGKLNIKPTTPQPKYERSVKVTYKPRATYTEETRKKLSSGTVRIAVEFCGDGSIGFVFPLPTVIDRDLVQQSVNAAKGIRFEPAMKDGKPVTVINFVEYGFFIG